MADVRIDGVAVMRRIHRVIDGGRRHYEDLLDRDDGVRLVRARATFASGRLLLDGKDPGLDGVPTVLAVGAAPATPPIAGANSVPYLTSDSLLQLRDLPRSLAIVGGGPIAVEFAQAMQRLGVPVTLVCRADAPLRGEEPEARHLVARVLIAEGVELVTGASGALLERTVDGIRLSWDGGHVDAEHVLLATGREPAVAGLHPEEAGIALDMGGIAVNDALATSAPGYWAIGDAVGGEHRRFQFTHAATFDGPQVAENILRGTANRPSYDAMPRVTFTDPEVAAVGLTESEARERDHDVHVHVKLIRELGKARAVGETEGFVKVVLDRRTKKLLGASVVASHGGDMLAELTTPLHVDGGSLDAVLATTFAHPTLSEGLKVAVRNALGELQ
jgi:pyruvate/2-oxoglutarate dehydrogenase complex dihydrolipoamide dehydrogenase (E3) component